jgi:hypothetical protein
VGLGDDLERVAETASAHGPVTAVLAAEPSPGRRAYLVALGEDDARRWLALDGDGRPIDRRETVREIASIVVMSELAGDVAGGGNLDELRTRLAQLRVTEGPPGIEEAEEAALALERVVGAPPHLASPAYLDAVGAATLALERALGEYVSPFTNAMKSAAGTADEFLRDVESNYELPLL